jgi:CrcB protein
METSYLTPVYISLGAILGALSRYFLTLYFTQRLNRNFPYGTFFINITGAFGMGFSATILQKMSAEQWLNAFINIGFLGAYTTFSTYALDCSNLWKLGNYKRALLYGLASPAIGFLAVEMGIALAQHF